MTCKAHLIVPGTRVIITNIAGYQFGPLTLMKTPEGFNEVFTPEDGASLEILSQPSRYYGEQIVKLRYKNTDMYALFTHVRRQTTPYFR